MTSLTGIRGPTGGNMSGRKTGDIIPKGFKKAQLQQFTPEQLELFQNTFAHVSPDSYLSKLAGGDESLFQEMEAPAMRQFNELQGGLASRFSGQGMGARRSSGFQNTSTAAASNFAQDLASRRQEMQRQAIQDLRGLTSDLLGQRPYDIGLVEKQQKQSKPALGGWGGALGAGLGGVGGFLFGGSAGAFEGAKIGSSLLGGL